ncbi:MAG: ATP-binding protein [[Clostridium] scindens]
MAEFQKECSGGIKTASMEERNRFRIARSHGTASFPANFILVAGFMNPCPYAAIIR